MSLNIVFQFGLFILSISSCLLIAKQNKYSIYGYWLGIFSQLLWARASIMSEQWGILAMVPFYLYSGVLGIKNFHEK